MYENLWAMAVRNSNSATRESSPRPVDHAVDDAQFQMMIKHMISFR